MGATREGKGSLGRSPRCLLNRDEVLLRPVAAWISLLPGREATVVVDGVALWLDECGGRQEMVMRLLRWWKDSSSSSSFSGSFPFDLDWVVVCSGLVVGLLDGSVGESIGESVDSDAAGAP